jgi:PKD repeat protein
MSFTYLRRAALALALFTAACTVKNNQPPPLTGPSGLALQLRLNAIPDSISQDGGSQSSIKITAIGPDGKGLAALPLRLDMFVNGTAQDYGSLSARSIVTGSDGVASAVYTAPPSPANGVFGSCSGLPGNCVSIVASPTSTNFTTSNPEQVTIRLVPTGVIVPPASSPTANFVVVPASPTANSPAQFDASSSCGGPLNGSSCPATAPSITKYSWNFGDGQNATGQTATHSFALSQTYTVTLSVTNSLGITSSIPKVITVTGGSLPQAQFTFSPSDAAVGQAVFFNAALSTPGQGHTLQSYGWTFGDGSVASGIAVTHPYAAAGQYRAQLTVVDDTGQSAVSSVTQITIGLGTTGPSPVFTYTPASPVGVGTSVTFDATPSSTTPAGTAPVIFQWQFQCPTKGCSPTNVPPDPGVTTTTSPRYQFAYPAAGTFLVTLTEFDTAGRSASTSRLITVQ